MTKREVAEKIAKLRRLARGTQNPHEAETAQRQADKLASEHGLTQDDLQRGREAAAFDEIVDAVGKILEQKILPAASAFPGSPSMLGGISGQIKNASSEGDKSKALKKIAKIVKVAAFVIGQHPVVAEIEAVVASALKNHDLNP